MKRKDLKSSPRSTPSRDRKRDKEIKQPIYGMEELPEFVRKQGVKMAILTVPAAVAQEVDEPLVQCRHHGHFEFCAHRARRARRSHGQQRQPRHRTGKFELFHPVITARARTAQLEIERSPGCIFACASSPMASDKVGSGVEPGCAELFGLRTFRAGFGLAVSGGAVVLVESDR